MPRMKQRSIYLLAVLSSLIFLSPSAAAQHAGHTSSAVNFPVSCTPAAQTEFNRALTLLHHMTYPQSRESFQRTAEIDPKCAMAQWGIAMTLFQPLWPTRPGPEARAVGWQAVEKAKTLQSQNQREQLFIAAMEAFYVDPASNDYWLRIRRWEQAMEKVYNAFPDDSEAATFYALAHLATTPADKITRANADRAAEILLRVYRKNPNHPGAMHYLVHANDVPGRERQLLEITRKYDSIAPNNPHAIHMPTHIYVRLGDWDGAIRGNLRAAKAALQYPAGDKRQYVWDEFCHAIEYLIYAYLQKGNNAAAGAQLHRLRTTPRLEPSFKTAFHLMSTQARYVLERHAWTEATQIVPRQPADLNWERATWPEAIARFARGLGFAHLGKMSEAKAENDRLNELEAATQKTGEDLFARNIRMLRLELSAWIAHVEGQQERFERVQERSALEDRAVSLMREAVELERTTPKAPVTPAPTLPAEELLGDLLMEQKKYSEALAAYKRSLALYPKRLNSVRGAARAGRALRR
jgi:tetratricopeptide (TPR) repeat protein